MKPDSDPSEGIRIAVSDIDPLNLVGEGDRNLRAIESHFGVSSVFRNGELLLFGSGDATRAASEILTFLVAEVRTGRVISESHVQDLLSGRLSPTPDAEPADDLVLSFERKTVRPRSPVQADYVRQIQRNDVVFGIGPAGTGKTYLASRWRSMRFARSTWIGSCSFAPSWRRERSWGICRVISRRRSIPTSVRSMMR